MFIVIFNSGWEEMFLQKNAWGGKEVHGDAPAPSELLKIIRCSYWQANSDAQVKNMVLMFRNCKGCSCTNSETIGDKMDKYLT